MVHVTWKSQILRDTLPIPDGFRKKIPFHGLSQRTKPQKKVRGCPIRITRGYLWFSLSPELSHSTKKNRAESLDHPFKKQPLHVWQIHGDLSADSGHPTCIPAGAAQACTHWSWAYIQMGFPPVVLDILYRLYRLNNHGNENSKTALLYVFYDQFYDQNCSTSPFFSHFFPVKHPVIIVPSWRAVGSRRGCLEKRPRIIAGMADHRGDRAAERWKNHNAGWRISTLKDS